MLDKRVVKWITDGIERDERYTSEDVIHGITSGKFKLFRYPEGIVVTQVTGHNRLLVFLLAGRNLWSWKKRATDDLRAYARSIGVAVIEAYGRPGLERMLKDLGWRKEQVVLRLR